MTDEERFLAWMREVDGRLIKEYSIGVDDLPDLPWEEWYKERIASDEAVMYAIEKVNNEDY